MSWLIARYFAVLLTVAAGLLTGYLFGGAAGSPRAGLVLGGMLGVLGAVASEARRGNRLMSWLRGALDSTAPRGSGIWGELAYRIERALHQRDTTIRQERERLAQFLSAIEASPNGVMLLDASESIEWCNSVAAAHFGLDPERDRRQRVTNLVRAPAFVAYLQARRFEDAVVFVGPLGRSTLSVQVRPYGEDMMLVLSQDITERERAEAMRRDFVANVSHEIRTPLTVLAGFLETMATLPLSEAERQHVQAHMQQQTARMQALVGDLLTLAQLEGSPQPGADRWLSVVDLLGRACADARVLSGGRHVIVADASDEAAIAGNVDELRSAVGNLLTNAVRYTPDGGHIVVRWCWRLGGGAGLEVSDTGIGIAREHIPRLTERFYRVDGSRSRDTGGTGLGLAIVKHVVQRHDGEIEISSQAGQGSVFRLIFPAFRVRRGGKPALPPPDPSGA